MVAQLPRQAGAVFVAICLCWATAGSLYYAPHSLSYFNEIAGGPDNGAEHLVDSNLDWGQDLFFLKKWYDAHPQARPFYLVYFGAMDPRCVGIEFVLPVAGASLKKPGSTRSARRCLKVTNTQFQMAEVDYRLYGSMKPLALKLRPKVRHTNSDIRSSFL